MVWDPSKWIRQLSLVKKGVSLLMKHQVEDNAIERLLLLRGPHPVFQPHIFECSCCVDGTIVPLDFSLNVMRLDFMRLDFMRLDFMRLDFMRLDFMKLLSALKELECACSAYPKRTDAVGRVRAKREAEATR